MRFGHLNLKAHLAIEAHDKLPRDVASPLLGPALVPRP
jgi:hypothetical protein